MSNFIQIHTLTSYPASLLNRDDVGFAKRIPFGGAVRTRISSQCLKRHWRTFEGKHSLNALGAEKSIRSRLTFDQMVLQPLIEELGDGADKERAEAAVEIVMAEFLGESAKAKKKKEDDGASVVTGQITVLGEAEIRKFKELASEIYKLEVDSKGLKAAAKKEVLKDSKKVLKEIAMSAGLSAALFGRMVTSDNLSRTDAAIHVAHALTVHEQESESDFFSAIDDLKRSEGGEDELGAGHIGTVELTSGLYYSYVVVDVPLLISNLSSNADLAAQVVESLIHLIATVSPGAKLGSTAPHARAHAVLVEAGDVQPRTLANAFLKPVRGSSPERAYQALVDFDAQERAMYEELADQDRVVAAMGSLPADLGVQPMSVDAVAKWAADKVRA